MAADSRAETASPGFRADLQTLRALAVVLVVLDHLVGRPSGGYVGVDVFFVLSGFLITGLLLREQERTGRISLVGFYRRRVKRLGPAAITALLAACALAALLCSAPRAGTTTTDALWAAGFAANWRFIAVGTDYLHGGGAVSPLQHFWSLSVEEQFYFVWPLLLIAVFACVRGRPGRTRIVAAALMGGILLASLAWGAHESAAAPTWAYFSTFSRTWELAAGALLACVAPLLTAIGPRARAVLAWGGIAAILGSAAALDANALFPVPGAIPAVLGSAAVIASGTGGRAPWTAPLRFRPLIGIGSGSYSLYLWHFPVIVFAGQLLPDHGRRYLVLSVVLMSALALLSYRWIEQPLRHAVWTRPLQSLRDRPPGVAGGLGRFGMPAVALVVVASSVLVFTLRSSPAVAAAPVTGLIGADRGSGSATRGAAIDAALAARTWPRLHPAVDRLGADAKAPQWIDDGCLGGDVHSLADPVANAERCVYGDPHGTRLLVLTGDSIAISYAPGLIAALGHDGWRIEIWTRAQCPAMDVTVTLADGSIDPDCARFRRVVVDHLRRARPDAVVVSNTSNGIDRLADHAVGPAALREWRTGTARTLSALASGSGRVVVLDDPPSSTGLQDCRSPISRPTDCVGVADPRYVAVATAQREGARSAASARIVYPDVLTWFCAPSGACPAFIGDTVTLADGMHLTRDASRSLAPLLESLLDR